MAGSVVVCGAGIAGVAVAYHLTVLRGLSDVVIVDPRPPLTLTSDKSTECYRNWWPSVEMTELMNRSIDLMEVMATESGGAFHMNGRGYLYVTADSHRLDGLVADARLAEQAGAGPVRLHADPGASAYQPVDAHDDGGAPSNGADVFLTGAGLRSRFPWLSAPAVGGIHVRRAGWLPAQQYGAWMLERSREAGAAMVRDEVVGLESVAGKLRRVRLRSGTSIAAGSLVLTPGPLLGRIATAIGEELPVSCEVHHKVALADHAGAMPRSAPMTIWMDEQSIPWDDDICEALAEEGRHDLLTTLPAACHGRPEGGPDSPWVLALWEYDRHVTDPVWPLPEDPLYPEVVVRGLATMIPGFAAYTDGLPRHVVDGGYYAKTPDNMPLIGPMRTRGVFVVGALSGYGIMAAAGAADLVVRHVVGDVVPPHARAFRCDRFDDVTYMATVSPDAGQL